MNDRALLRRVAVVGSALVLAAGLSGCSMLNSLLGSGGGDAPRDDKSQVTASSNIGIFNLKLGDCKMSDTGTTISETDVVPCDKPHDEEVFYEFKIRNESTIDVKFMLEFILFSDLPINH